MGTFSAHYCEQNPDVFANADTAYVLAFAIIMLNTDAHSPQVKTRMSLEEFVRNNRGINDGGDLPESLLSAVYHDIVHREIKTGTDFDDLAEAELVEWLRQGTVRLVPSNPSHLLLLFDYQSYLFKTLLLVLVVVVFVVGITVWCGGGGGR